MREGIGAVVAGLTAEAIARCATKIGKFLTRVGGWSGGIRPVAACTGCARAQRHVLSKIGDSASQPSCQHTRLRSTRQRRRSWTCLQRHPAPFHTTHTQAPHLPAVGVTDGVAGVRQFAGQTVRRLHGVPSASNPACTHVHVSKLLACHACALATMQGCGKPELG